jgi:hypothetical protein
MNISHEKFQFFLKGIMYHIFVEAGDLELYYYFQSDTLFIRKVEKYYNRADISSDRIYEFKIEDPAQDHKQILKDFLLEAEENRFYSEQIIDKESPLFSKNELDEINNIALGRLRAKEERNRQKHAEKEIVVFCDKEGLNPRPTNGDSEQWLANCPNGRHNIMIAVDTGEWGCGYCKKKGKLSQLRNWISNMSRN